MALTRPRLGQLNTSIVAQSDPITVLNQGASSANVDVGFLFNRANGLVSNVALYWSESAQSIVTAYTSSTGSTNSNISVASYANLTVGNVLTVNGGIIGIVGNLTLGNLIANTGVYTVSSVVSGNVVAGNVLASGFFYANGSPFVSSSYGNVQMLANLAAGSNPVTFGSNIITGHILPSANVTYDIGSSTLRFRTLYISGTTIDMGGAQITTDSTSGGFAFVPKPTTANPNPLGTVFSPSGGITTINTTGGIVAAGTINTSIENFQGTAKFGNVRLNSEASSTSTTTGALVVVGGAGIAGNVFAGNVLASGFFYANGTPFVSSSYGNVQMLANLAAGSNPVAFGSNLTVTNAVTAANVYTTGIYIGSGSATGGLRWSANGAVVNNGITYTAGTSPPGYPLLGDQWYNTSTDVLYEYINDGTSSYWVDVVGPVLTASGVSATVAATTIAYPSSATAADTAGGQTITVTGTGFNAGITAYINATSCSTTYGNSTSLTFTTPATSAGPYNVTLYNTDGTTGTRPGGIIFSAPPVWVTAAGALTAGGVNISYSQSVSATGTGITYGVTSGALPTGLSLNSSSGAITGTPTVADTFNFTITATNTYNQTTARAFSILITNTTPTVEYLVVAGGGGGGYGGGGGGGAGGYRTAINFAVSSGTPITVTIGAGGGGAASDTPGTVGTDSSFSTITSTGGGGGGTGDAKIGGTAYATTGGSGGGAKMNGNMAGANGNTPSTSPSQGNNGGSCLFSGAAGAGGGGGAGAAGGNGNTGDIAGNGGVGLNWNSLGTYYAGGGGGGTGGGTAGTGGTGGGGNGSNTGGVAGSPGTVNTGGGGGGGKWSAQTNGGTGGSGVVIIRYTDTYPAATGTTGSPTYTTPTGYRVYTFTASGTITF